MFEDVKQFFTTVYDGNIAYHVVDKSQYNKVDIAREKLAKTYDINISNLKYMDQVHGCDIKVVDEQNSFYTSCDALITDKKDTPLMVMSADCIGILFYDNVKKVIAVAHAGRNGTFLSIASKVIEKMVSEYKSNPRDIEVSMGPSIGKCCYEVSIEMVDIVVKNFGNEFVSGRYIDLQSINKKQLLQSGVKVENISISQICTKCNGKDYFSYRNDKNCGRFAGVISL